MSHCQTEPDVSIIIPIYKVEGYIIDCLRSVIEQDVSYEIILIDDCGGDKSSELAEEFLQQCPHLKGEQWQILRHEHNRGLSAARNTGTQAARGKYIYYLDSDDMLLPCALQSMISLAESTNAHVVMAYVKLSDGGEWKHQFAHGELIEGTESRDAFLRRAWIETAWNKLILREFILTQQLQFVEGIIHEDEVWSLELACLQPKIAFLQESTIYYRINRPDSIIHIARSQNQLKGGIALMKILKLCTLIGQKYELMHNAVFHDHLQMWILDILFVKLAKQPVSFAQKWRYYAEFAKFFPPALKKNWGIKQDWRFRALGYITYLPSCLASGGVQLFLALWKLRPGARLQSILNSLQ